MEHINIEKRKRVGSISMSIDKHIEHSTIWVDDHDIYNCEGCDASFHFLNRKHHCRHCGKIFCSYCSNYWINIPNHQKYINHYWNIQTYFNHSEKQRVCTKCYIKIDELNQFINTIDFFALLGLNMKDYINIAQTCKSWNKVANYYFSYFKEIQYYLPDHEYTQKDVNILKNNMNFISGHSKWMIQLIRIEQHIHKDDLLHLLHRKRDIPCNHLMCGKSCNERLQAEDIIVCLYNDMNHIEIFRYLVECLGENDLIFYLSFIIFKLRDFIHKKDYLDILLTYLFHNAKQSISIANKLFWELTQYIHDVVHKDFYIHIRKRFVKQLDKRSHTHFSKTYDFTNVLIDIVEHSNDIKEDIHNYLKKTNSRFHLPICIKHTYETIFIHKIKIIDSKTKPVMIPCVDIDNNVDMYMIKMEDIRKENLIMNIIKLMNHLLIKQVGLDLNIVTYNILPISSKSGFIECVKHSHTLYGIREEQLFSIQNFIMEKNPSITAGELRENFTKSCAAYCIITYLLGIGDRHLDNIMITDNGFIFNIDFGYVLGKDPKLMAPEFRITSEMIDAMGGNQSKYYKQFQQYCKTAYNCLRLNTPIFYTLLSLLYNIEPPLLHPTYTKTYVHNQIIDRFVPYQPYKPIDFQYKIIANSNTYSGNMIDYFHKKNKTTSSSTSSTDNIYHSAINALETTKDIGLNIGNGIKHLFWG